MSATSRSSLRRRGFAAAAFVLGAITVSWLALARDGLVAPVGAESPAQTAAPAHSAAVTDGRPSAPERRLAIAQTEAPQAPPPDFEALVDRLIAQGHETAAHAQDDEIELAKASDRRAQATFAAILEHFADAGERALQLAAGHAVPDDDAHAAAICTVCRMILAAELERRDRLCAASGDRSPIDPLVANVLAMLPTGDRLADSAGATLFDRPFLRLVHEPAVLQLVDLAGEGRFARPIATRLLLTLWDNVQRFGERSSDDLASLALLLLGDGDESRRIAACRHLLQHERHRRTVLAWLREREDVRAAAEVAQLAAGELPPADAVAVLRELGPLLRSMPSAYMALGHRSPEVVALAYEQLLADNVQPAARRDLLAGLGMAADGRGTLELALQNDPDPRARLQALLSLSASAAQTCGEAACERLLDDPAIAADPAHLAIVVMALENLEVAGLVNAVDRLGQRLQLLPLGDDARQRLEQILARTLPGGRTSAAGAGSGRSVR